MWGLQPALLAAAVVADLSLGVLGARPQLHEESLALHASPDPHAQARAQKDTPADTVTTTAAAAAARADGRAGTAIAAGLEGQDATAADAATRAETTTTGVATDASTAAAGAERAAAACADEAAVVGGGGDGKAECTEDMSIKQLNDALQVPLLRLDCNRTRSACAEAIGTCLRKNEKRLDQLPPETLHAVVSGVIKHLPDQNLTVRHVFASSLNITAPLVATHLAPLRANLIDALEMRLKDESDEKTKQELHDAFKNVQTGIGRRRDLLRQMQERLTKEVGSQVTVNDDDLVCVPRSVMLLAENATRDGIKAHRCPNRKACGKSGTDPCWDWASLHRNSTLNQAMCAEGYNHTVPGCAQCLPGFGRSRMDPFKCAECTSPAFVWGKEIAASGAVFAASLHSISAGRQDKLGRLLNIFMSFSFSAITASTLMQDTRAYGKFIRLINKSPRGQLPLELLDVPLLVASTGTGGLTDSADCMGVNFKNSFAMRTLLESLVPMLLLLAAIGATLFRGDGGSRRAQDSQADAEPMDDMGDSAGEGTNEALETDTEQDVKEPAKADGKARMPQEALVLGTGYSAGEGTNKALETYTEEDVKESAKVDEKARMPQEALVSGGPGTSQDVDLHDVEVHHEMPVKIMHISLAFTNVFLPGLFASALLQYPCFHTQRVHNDLRWYEESRRAWDTREKCPRFYSVQTVTCAVVTFVVGPVMGPAYWAYLIANMEKLPHHSLDFMVAPYKPDCKPWEIIVLMRKLALVALAAMVPETYASASHVTFAVIITGTALAAHLYWQPYKSKFLNWVEGTSLFATFIAMALIAYVVSAEWSQTLVHEIFVVVLVLALLLMTLLLLLSLLAHACCQKLFAWLSSMRNDIGLVPCYCAMFSAVLVPALTAVFVYSPVGQGPDIYNGILNDRSNALANCMVFILVCWLMVMFVFDMFDSDMWGRGGEAVVQFLSFSILVVLIFCSVTLKSVEYPWAPLLMCMVATVCLLAFLRARWMASAVGPPHFYSAAAICYNICAALALVVWIVWNVQSDGPRALWWSAGAERWLAGRYASVYRALTPGELASEARPQELQDYCLDQALLHSSIVNASTKGLVASACREASAVIFTQWAGPFTVFACNLLGAGVCVLFSDAIAEISAASESVVAQDRTKALIRFVKRFLLTIVFAVAVMYTSLYVSGVAVKLGSAMLAFACIALVVMFLWLTWEVDTQTLNETMEELPLMKHAMDILQSNWMRAIVVGGMAGMIPFIVALDKVRQQVRKSSTNYYSRESWSELNNDQHTPPCSRLRESLEKWDWTDILSKVCALAEVLVLLAVGSKATFILFSYLNGKIEAAGLGIGTISVMLWAIGLLMFMNPVVPGSAVYLFTGVVLGAQSQRDGSVGIWAGLALACVAGSGAKLLACLGQYSLGYFMGKSVKVQNFVGVTKVGVLATEAVLKEEGFRLFKVCILVAGPDFPTSVLCGILQLNILEMLLGTLPVILVSIIPQTFVGVLLTKEGATEGVWALIATGATGLAAAFQAGATVVFAYGVMQRVEQSGEQLLKAHRPEHDEARKLAEREAERAKRYGEIADWGQLGTPARATLLGAVALFWLSGCILAVDTMATEKICFREFSITDKIKSSYDLGGLDGSVLNVVLAPMGWIALGLAAVAGALHVAFGQWLAAAARAAL